MNRSLEPQKLAVAGPLVQQAGLLVAAEQRMHERERQLAERERALQSQIALWELDRPRREAAVLAEEADLLARLAGARQKLDAANEELALVRGQIGLLKKAEHSARDVLGQLLKQLEAARNDVREGHERRSQPAA